MLQPLKVALAGLGTVGGGTLKLLDAGKERIRERSGRPIHLVAVAERDSTKLTGLPLGGAAVFADAGRLADEADYDVLVELIGGSDGIARTVCERAIARGRHVVTANKALLAHHGTALARAAESAQVSLRYEAAVAGGIPIIKALREGLAGNAITSIYGILNGTSNYILTTMRKTGRSFDDVLAEAQRLGYAEADPSFDVDGVDAAHKLTILASVAFGCAVDFKAVHIEGIRHISPLDIQFANDLGYRIKLLGIARMTEHGIERRVHPCMVPLGTPIAHVDGVFNAVVVDGDFVDKTMYEGRGAGEKPTASAVVADLIDIAAGRVAPTLGVPVSALKNIPAAPMDRLRNSFYVRLMVVDRPGVFAEIATALGEHGVSMESVLQRGRAPGEAVPVVLTTHDTEEGALGLALAKIASLGTVVETPRLIRIVSLDGAN